VLQHGPYIRPCVYIQSVFTPTIWCVLMYELRYYSLWESWLLWIHVALHWYNYRCGQLGVFVPCPDGDDRQWWRSDGRSEVALAQAQAQARVRFCWGLATGRRPPARRRVRWRRWPNLSLTWADGDHHVGKCQCVQHKGYWLERVQRRRPFFYTTDSWSYHAPVV